MTYAIVLSFDIKSTEKIKQKIMDIAEANINPYMINNKIPPHMTISLFEADDELNLYKILKNMRLCVAKRHIKICSVEVFEPKVIYYAPEKSNFLITLNEMATNNLVKIGADLDKYYLPDRWVPHIALGVQLTTNELTRALEIVKIGFEPFDVLIEKVILARCNPYNEIIEYYI